MDFQPIAVIPARMGSERFPRKNLALFCGKPLLRWTLDTLVLLGEALFEQIIVSSESREVGDLVMEMSLASMVWHERPAFWAGDDATVDDVLRALPVREDAVLYVLLPTSPLRSGLSIQRAWEYFKEQQPDAEGLLSLTRAMPHPLWAMGWDGHRVTPVFPSSYSMPRTALGGLFFHDGGHYIIKRGVLDHPAYDRQLLGWLSPPEESIDIDTQEDLHYAEFLVEQRSHRN